MEKNAEYLRLLQERNKLKKLMTTKTKDEIIKEELERGFKTQFRGANASKDNEKTPPPVKVSTKQSSAINKIILDTNKVWGKHQHTAVNKDDMINFNYDHKSSFHTTDENDDKKDEISSDYEPDFDEPSDIEENIESQVALNHNKNVIASSSWNEEDEEKIQLYINELKHNSDIIPSSQSYKNIEEAFTSESEVTNDNGQGHSVLPSANPTYPRIISKEDIISENDHSDLDLTLQSKVKVLSSEQKRKLLQLLKADEPLTPDRNLKKSGIKHIIGNSVIENNIPSTPSTLPQKSIHNVDINNHNLDSNEQSQQPSYADSASVSTLNPKIDTIISMQSLLIRIKILTQWTKSKFISLKAIRLRAASTISSSQKYMDFLHHFKTKVNSGMVTMPSSSETVRNLSMLTSGTNKPSLLMPIIDAKSQYPVSKTVDVNAVHWKAPFSTEKSIELIFEGDIGGKANFPSSLDEFSLLLWNNESQGENFSAVKDVDIYIGSMCIWSGQLDEGGRHDVLLSNENQAIFHNNELPPAIIISPLSINTTKSSKSYQVCNNITTTTNNNTMKITPSMEQPVKSIDFPVVEMSGTKHNSTINNEAAIKPNWLVEDDAKLPVNAKLQENDIFRDPNVIVVPPKSANRRSRNQAETSIDLKSTLLLLSPNSKMNNFTGKNKTVSNEKVLSGVGTVASPSNSQTLINIPNTLANNIEKTNLDLISENKSADKRRSLRRNRSHLLKDVNQRTSSPMKGLLISDTTFSDDTIPQQTEEELEQSLDAISFAQKFDMGRITNDATNKRMNVLNKNNSINNLSIEDSLNQNNDQLDALKNITNIQSSLLSSPIKKKSIPSNLTGNDNTSAYSASPNKKIHRGTNDRSAKIDLVQEKINSTLAGLANIIAKVPNTSTGGIVNDTNVATGIIPEEIKAQNNEILMVMPFGNIVTIDVLSTWGDQNYVGLNGIEFYDDVGKLVNVNLNDDKPISRNEEYTAYIKSITAFPSGLGDVPGKASKDPRKVSNLLDGVNFTRNDLHVWLAPHLRITNSFNSDEFAALQDKSSLIARIKVLFNKEIHISMIRIFNYNKSRTHSQRGIRRCRISINDKAVFEGEIKRASGQLLSEESEYHLITFTADTKLHSCVLPDEKFIDADNEIDLEESWANHSLARPQTSQGLVQTQVVASNDWDNNQVMDQSLPLNSSAHPVKTEETFHILSQPYEAQPIPSITQATVVIPVVVDKQRDIEATKLVEESKIINRSSTYIPEDFLVSVKCSRLHFEIESTWGDLSYVGICGIELLLSPDRTVLKVTADQLDASPRDLSEIGFFDDPRVLKNLINGSNDTAKDINMWLIPFTKNAKHFIKIDLRKEVQLVGFRFWNYNKSSEDVLRGCKQMLINIDDKPLFRCLLRPGPGCDGVVFGQTILFRDVLDIMEGNRRSQYAVAAVGTSMKDFHGDRNSRMRGVYISPTVRQDYETTVHPTGLLWKFTFFNNWNDGYYIGLDCIEMFDKDGKIIDVSYLAAQISAVPYALDDLAIDNPNATKGNTDPRKPQNLFNYNGNNAIPCSWLCPLSRCMTPQERANCAERVRMQTQNTGSIHTTAVGGKELYSLDYSFPQNNVLFVMFQHPVSLSAIKFYNYSKTPSRGVKDFMIELDGRILYMGALKKSDEELSNLLYEKPRVINNTATSTMIGGGGGGSGLGRQHRTRGQSVIFSNDMKVSQAHKETISYCGSTEQDVLCINERQVMVRSKTMYDQEPANIFLEGIHADLNKRPVTAFIQ